MRQVGRAGQFIRNCSVPATPEIPDKFSDKEVVMKPVNTGGHATYQEQLVIRLKQYYPDAFVRFGPNLFAMIDNFFNLDLSKVEVIMADRYSIFGPEPRLPSGKIRSMMVALKMKVTNYTAWSSELKMNHLAAIISRFDPDDTPGVGTFYDFTDRLWLSDKNNISPHAKPPKMKKVQKPKNPNDKADPIEDITVDQLIERLKASPPTADQLMPGCSSFSKRSSWIIQ